MNFSKSVKSFLCLTFLLFMAIPVFASPTSYVVETRYDLLSATEHITAESRFLRNNDSFLFAGVVYLGSKSVVVSGVLGQGQNIFVLHNQGWEKRLVLPKDFLFLNREDPIMRLNNVRVGLMPNMRQFEEYYVVPLSRFPLLFLNESFISFKLHDAVPIKSSLVLLKNNETIQYRTEVVFVRPSGQLNLTVTTIISQINKQVVIPSPNDFQLKTCVRSGDTSIGQAL